MGTRGAQVQVARAAIGRSRQASASRGERGQGPAVRRALGKADAARALGSVGAPGLLQPKLKVGPARDRFELEADRSAERVMRMATVAGASSAVLGAAAVVQRRCGSCGGELELQRAGMVQRKCAKCEEELQRACSKCEEELQREPAVAGSGGPAAEPDLDRQVRPLRHGGRPLSPALRSFFEPRFGRDFSAVRLHTGAEAARAASAINARAFTLGNHIAFGAGEYAPGSFEGRRLLAHELTHTVQQGHAPALSGPGPLPGAAGPAAAPAPLSAPSTLQRDLLDRIGSGIVSGGEGALELGESAVDLAVDAGEAVVDLGEDVVEGVAGIASEVWEFARSLASAIGSVVEIDGTALRINIPPLSPCPLEALTVELPVPDLYLPIFDGTLTINEMQLTGSLGALLEMSPELFLQLGPCEVSGSIVIDPLFFHYGARVDLSLTVAGGMSQTLFAGAAGPLQATFTMPSGGQLVLPPLWTEIGLEGQAFGVAGSTLSTGVALDFHGLSFSYGGYLNYALGLAAGIGLGGAVGLSYNGVNLCRLYWPLWSWADELTVGFGYGLGISLTRSGLGVSLDLAAAGYTVSGFPFDQLGIAFGRELLQGSCWLCDAAYQLGIMPSQLGWNWRGGYPLPEHRGPLRGVHQKAPEGLTALCRGACGPDCDTCSPSAEGEDRILCQNIGGGRHEFWRYPGFVTCKTHSACQNHDTCYDVCAAGGESVFGPCHRLCDFECLCLHGVPNCASWIFGAGPDEGSLQFSEPPRMIGTCRGSCPRGPNEAEEGETPTWRVCLDDYTLFDAQELTHDLGQFSTGNVELWEQLVWDIPPVTAELYARADMEAAISAGLGPAVFTDLCLTFNPETGKYGGTAQLNLDASLGGMIAVTGVLGGGLDLLSFDFLRAACAEGSLRAEARPQLTFSGALRSELMSRGFVNQRVPVTCAGNDLSMTTSLLITPRLSLDFDLTAGILVQLGFFEPLRTEAWRDSWRLLSRHWSTEWQVEIQLPALAAGIMPAVAVVGQLVDLNEIISWLFELAHGASIDGGETEEDELEACGGSPDEPDEPDDGHVPTGLTREDPIEMRWFKPKAEYLPLARLVVQERPRPACDPSQPNPCSAPTPECTQVYIGGRPQHRCAQLEDFPLDTPRTLPALDGRYQAIDVGVAYYPALNDVVVLDPVTRGGTADLFKKRFARHGHRLQDHDEQPDHVLDLDWNGADSFSNLWPLDAEVNIPAGREQNLFQRVTFAEQEGGTVHRDMTLLTFKRRNFHRGPPAHKYFIITNVTRP